MTPYIKAAALLVLYNLLVVAVPLVLFSQVNWAMVIAANAYLAAMAAVLWYAQRGE